MKTIRIAALMLTIASTVLCAGAQNTEASTNFKRWEFRPYFSSNWGLTSSYSIPAETRKINSTSKFHYNPIIGVDINCMFSPKWGLNTGLRFERKASSSSVYMENFLTTITLAGEGTPTHGYFTGDVANTYDFKYLTLPVMGLYRINHKWDVRAGLYFAYALSKSYTGTATNGKIRESPLVPAVGVDNSTSDFSDDLSSFDMGIQAGVVCAIWKKLTVDMTINYGLINQMDSPASGMTMPVYHFYFSCGLGWKF